MIKNILILLCYLVLYRAAALANMANPMAPQSMSAQLIPAGSVRVTNERIDIRFTKDTLDGDDYSEFSVVYHIHAEQAMELPLVFLGFNVHGLEQVMVNGKSAPSQQLDQQQEKFSFLRYKDNSYQISYDGQDWKDVALSDAFYFTAKLNKGQNTIAVRYNAYMGYDRRDILTKYNIKYLLFPSKYWASFGPIDLFLHLSNNKEIYTQDLGTPHRLTDSLAHWKIESIHHKESFHIQVAERISFVAKAILWISPEILALIGSILFIYLHLHYIYKKYKLGKYRYALWIGNLIVPSSFFLFYWFWCSLANYLINGFFDEKSRGFTLLVILTLPIIYLVYDLVLFIVDRSIRSRFQKQQPN